MKTYKIALIPGDGIGPEVINEGLKVLDAAAKKFGFKLDKTHFDFGGERYLRSKQTLTEADIAQLRKFDAIYLGGIGHPSVKPGILEREILLKLRFDLDLFVNLRPVKLYENVETPIKNKGPEHIDYVVVRENTGDVYTGAGKVTDKGTDNEIAIQSMIYTRRQVDRIIRYAFDYVSTHHADASWRGLTEQERGKGFIGKVTMCGKTNVLTYVFDLWQRVFEEIAQDYPNILTDYVHVDAMCIYMIEQPERFDVIVTSNMFGDIITDLAAVTQGGMGVAPSANINPGQVSMFEPVHGTAPQFAGKNVINPIAAIATASMMLNYLGEEVAARSVENSMKEIIKRMQSMLVGKMGYGTNEIGAMVAEGLE